MGILSIITICYNEPNLERTCESIVNQTCQNFEWIVIDGGSNEETQRIWDKYKYRINKFVSEPDNGIYDAYNKGLKFAHAKYVNFMNAGDYYHTNGVLEKVYASFKNSKADIIYGDTKYLPNKFNENLDYICPKVLDDNILISQNINTQAMFIKKNLYKKFGYFDTEYKCLSDWDRVLCFYANKVKFKYIDIVVADYDTNGISSTQREICQKEHDLIKSKYFTDDGIIDERIIKETYTFLEQIFSVKQSANKTHKIITIFGIHIKIKIERENNK